MCSLVTNKSFCLSKVIPKVHSLHPLTHPSLNLSPALPWPCLLHSCWWAPVWAPAASLVHHSQRMLHRNPHRQPFSSCPRTAEYPQKIPCEPPEPTCSCHFYQHTSLHRADGNWAAGSQQLCWVLRNRELCHPTCLTPDNGLWNT